MHAYLTNPVGKLTRRRPWRLGALPTAGLLLLLCAANPAATADWHPVEDIRAAAADYLRRTLARGDGRVVPEPGHLDPRLQLPRCNAPLDPYIKSGRKTGGRMVVGVRCAGERPWNVYLPVHVAVMEEVLVTARSLPRGHRLDAADIETTRRDVSGLTGGYMTGTSGVVGQHLRRPVVGGTIITDALLEAAILIERGQTVTLSVESDTVNIRMTGKALMDGAANQRIRVENLASGRVVEGLVRSSQHVQVLLE